MTDTPANTPPLAYLPPQATPAEPAIRNAPLLKELLLLSAPIVVEQTLHMLVGLTDVYLCGRLPQHATEATAAVGVIAYVTWLVGLIAGAIGTGATALIARATGARHRSLANSVCGQSVGAAGLVGLLLGGIGFAAAGPIVRLTGLSGLAGDYALFYFQLVAASLPFSIVMFAANACLRGAGDTLTPAIAMVVVDVVNIVVSAGLVYGWGPFPRIGFEGIAIGTGVAYCAGGLLQFVVLLSGRGKLRLHLHRLRPHWHNLRRILRIGIPSGVEGALTWIAHFGVVRIIVAIDHTNIMAAAHIITIRAESLSYMLGFAISMAAATMVGQSLGMKQPQRATRSAYLAYAFAAAVMGLWGLAFLLFGRPICRVLTNDPATMQLAADCLWITAWCQLGFAAAMVFGGALRGAGDTFIPMLLNLASTIFLRLGIVLGVTLWLGYGLRAIWIVLASELFARGVLMYLRFVQGGWKRVKV